MAINVTQATRVDFDPIAMDPSQERILIYFWGPDCPNCEIFASHLPDVLQALEVPSSKAPFTLVKVNAYENTELATRFGLFGIPTFLLLKKGRVIGKMTSFHSLDFFVDVVKEKLLT